jgi:hypothetical protein
MADENYLMEKKIEYMIDLKIKKINNDLVQAVSKINSMAGEIEVLRNKVERLNATPSAPARMPVEQPEAIQPPQQQTVAAARNSQNFQRTGNFQPKDVSIEKMFYFGNK